MNRVSGTERIAKNTIVLYIRMLVCMLISLYSSRLVLQALGVVDYGIYNAVGGFVMLFSAVANSLSSATSRFLTYELGRGEITKLKKTFTTAFTIQMVMCAIVLLLAETVGLWFLNTQMTIPPERLDAAFWVFQCSVFSSLGGFLTVPFNASVISHERMGIYAVLSVFEVLAKLLIAMYLVFCSCPFDNLMVYAVLWLFVSLLVQGTTWAYCILHFSECRVGVCTEKAIYQEMIGYASWNFLGSLAAVCSGQGVNVVLNIVFGPVVNAARGIAVTVNNIVSNFVNSFTTAINPQITKSYAAEDFTRMRQLVCLGTRFSYYTMLMLTMPLLLETDFILTMWLGDFPEHTVNFMRMSLVVSLIDILTIILGMAQYSTGKVRNYQLVVGTLMLLNLPLSYAVLKMVAVPEAAYVIGILIAFCCMFARLKIVSQSIALDIKTFFRDVYLNILLTTGVSAIIPYILHCTLGNTTFLSIIVIFVSVLSTAVTAFFVGCHTDERVFILKMIRAKLPC